MHLIDYTYPFDPNGTATTNKVVGERHTITPVNGSDFRFIVPRAAPYFRTSMKLIHVASGVELLEGIHWAPGHKFVRASDTPPFMAIYGSVMILDNNFEGVIELTEYQTLGGEFTINEAAALELLANAQLDPRLATWDNVLNKPTTYDPLLHRHHASESTGYEDFVDTLNRLATAIEATIGTGTVDSVARSHIGNMNNPHNTRLSQLPDAQHLLNLTPSVVNTIINIVNGGGGGGTGGGGAQVPSVPAGFQLVSGQFFIPDNESDPVEYELPVNPIDYAVVRWVASGTSFGANAMTIRSTDKTIMGVDEPLVVNELGVCGMLIFMPETQTWWVYKTGIGAGGTSGAGTTGLGYPTSSILRVGQIFVPKNDQGPVEYDLPPNPTDLAMVEWIASPTSFAVNPMTIRKTDRQIEGQDDAVIVNTKGQGGRLVYFESTQSWKLYLASMGSTLS